MPINARMFVEDCEDPEWMHGYDIDLVHFRGIAGVLGDLDSVVANSYRYDLAAIGYVPCRS